ncbi:RNA polymerase sigma factor [bacterium]|nr:RNA polymerase sigma factor [bacterium]
MTEPDEIELINQAKAGSSTAFEVLVRQHYTFVYKVAFKWCRLKEDAEDITQEVFIKLARNIMDFKQSSAFKTWLYRITINTAKDLMIKKQRALKNESAYLEAEKEKSGHVDREAAMADKLISLIESLPQKLKDAALLVYSEGLSHKEAAGILDCAETTVSWRLFQVKKKLKISLKSGELI